MADKVLIQHQLVRVYRIIELNSPGRSSGLHYAERIRDLEGNASSIAFVYSQALLEQVDK